MKKKLLVYILCAGLILACGCSQSDKTDEASSDDVNVGTNVTTYITEPGSMEASQSYTGNLEASQSVSISSKVSAKAESVPAKEGDYVEAGDVLLRLDQTDIALAYNQAKAAYDSAVAGYNSVINASSKQQIAQAEQALINAQNAYNQAKNNYDVEKTLFDNASGVKVAKQSYEDAKANYERIQQLFSMGGASKLDVDTAYSTMYSAEQNYISVQATAEAPLKAALLTLQNAESALQIAKNNVALTKDSANASIETAKASVNSAKAALDIAQNNLSNTTITAPISGYLSSCNVTTGQLVPAGTPIFEIKNSSLIDVEINVTDSVIPLIFVGTKASVSIPSASIDNIEGSVTSIDPVKDDMTGLYKVKVGITNDDGKVNVGMMADVKLITSSVTDAIKIPSEALINEGEAYYVYVAEGDVAVKKEVEIGISDSIFTEIVSGLEPDSEVIVDGKDYLSEKNNEIHITGQWEE